MYTKIDLITFDILDEVDELPDNINGLSQETLDNLSAIADQLPEYNNIGFWPTTYEFNSYVDQTKIDMLNKRITFFAKKPNVNVYYGPPQVYFPDIGNEEIHTDPNSGKPITTITCVGNIFTRMMYFVKAGDVMEDHCHAYDHPTLLAKGTVEVDYQGIKTFFAAPAIIYIKAETHHQITALEDGTLAYCIHPLRNNDAEGDILDPASIPNGINPVTIAKRLLVNE